MVKRYSKFDVKEGRETIFIENIGYARGAFKDVCIMYLVCFCRVYLTYKSYLSILFIFYAFIYATTICALKLIDSYYLQKG